MLVEEKHTFLKFSIINRKLEKTVTCQGRGRNNSCDKHTQNQDHEIAEADKTGGFLSIVTEA